MIIGLIRGMLLFGVTAAFLTETASASSITLTLSPAGGNVSGSPGSTVGWGYTLENDTADWIEATSLSAGPFQDGTPNNIFDFPDLAPFSSITVDFAGVASAACPSAPCGLYDFVWDSFTTSGFVNSGVFTISSEFFDRDPSDPLALDLGPAPDTLADYSASVSSTVTAAPEPPTLMLAAAFLCTLAIWIRRESKYPSKI